MSQVNFLGEFLPMVMLFVPAVVISESAGMGDYNENPNSNKTKRDSAHASSLGALLVIPLSFAAWIIGMMAVDETNLELYSITTILNVVLGVVILIVHTLGNCRARQLLAKLLCCCRCKSLKIDPADPDSGSPSNLDGNDAGNQPMTSDDDTINLDKMIREAVSRI
jgi:hypothetical protein